MFKVTDVIARLWSNTREIQIIRRGASKCFFFYKFLFTPILSCFATARLENAAAISRLHSCSADSVSVVQPAPWQLSVTGTCSPVVAVTDVSNCAPMLGVRLH